MDAPAVHGGDRSEIFIRLSTACIILPSIAVAVRFWSRTVGQGGKYGLDDWFCLLALAFNITLCGLGITWAKKGLGRHIDDVEPEELVAGLKILTGCYFIFDISIGIVKTSALCFYSRVFSNQKKGFKIAIWVGHTFVVLWYIYVILEDSLNCIPLSKEWNPDEPGQCANLFVTYLVTGIWDCALDLYILILPLPVLWSLQMRLKRKLLIASAFILGYCCLVASIGRLVTTILTGDALAVDLTWNAVGILTWTWLEPGLGIISLCVPSWYYLYIRWRKQGLMSLFTTRDQAHTSQIMFAHNSRRKDGSSSWLSRLTGRRNISDTDIMMPTQNSVDGTTSSTLRGKGSDGALAKARPASSEQV